MRRLFWFAAAAAAMGLAAPDAARAEGLPDARIQAPELKAPGRASLAGEYGKTALEAEDVARGSFSRPLPLALPGERGAPGIAFVPSYSPGAGLSEWGMGWENNLAISRFAVVGEPDLTLPDGDLTGPWGRMVRGSDGAWYPLGLASMIRVEALGDELHAYLPDGTVQVYGRGADRLAVPRPGGGVATYTWYLGEVRELDGALTRLTWSTFGSARRYLTAVEYGGRGPFTQYRVEIGLVPLARPFVDYRAGVEQRLDRRVKTVRVLARHLVTGEWAERWTYELGHATDGWGPVFYLVELQRTFASNAVEPAARYGYHFADDAVGAARMRRVRDVEQLFTDWGADAIQPEYATIADVDDDGRPDLEHHRANQLYRRVDTGFVREDLPPLPPGTHWACREPAGPNNAPRELVQMLPETDELEVVRLELSGSGMTTALYVCTREGALLHHEVLDGDWALGSLTRLVDVDRDQRPDLVKVTPGGYEVLRNLSDGAGVRWDAPVERPLEDFGADTIWVQDMNGDGVADLVGRGENVLRVWYGRTGRDFAAPGTELAFRTGFGWDLTDLADHDLRFVDANHDGMTDVLLVQAGAIVLFANTGARFEEVHVPALAYLSTNVSMPVVADLAGTGGAEVVVSHGSRAYSLAFDRPETGLLATADDGKGNVLTLTYERAPAAPGAGSRPSVLASIETRSTGAEPVTWRYAYAHPYTHSVGQYLVGYGEVARIGPRGRQDVALAQGDTFAGVLVARVETDAGAPDVERFETREHDDAIFRGVAWKRPRRTVKGWRPRGGGAEVSESSEVLAYAAEVCPARVRSSGATGTLVVERERAELPALSGHLHCLDARTTGAGTHADSRWDFVHGQRIERNDLGMPLVVWSAAASGDLELQRIAYDADLNPVSLEAPGRGVTLVEWRAGAGLLEQVIQPDGVIIAVTARDPVTDAILEITTTRGARSYRQFFRYDGMERLERRWDDLGGAGEALPGERLEYRHATATQPAAVRVVALVDAIDGITRESVVFSAGDGTTLAEATRRPEGWVFGELSRSFASQGLGVSLLRAPLALGADPLALDVDGVFAGARELVRAEASGFGVSPDTTTVVQQGVARRVTERLAVSGGYVTVTATENGVISSLRRRDAAGLPVQLVDEEGYVWSYAHDAAGRVREVVLPDGARHTVFHDDHGRVALITRTGVAQLAYAYEPATGRLASVTTLTAAGEPRLERAYVYDAVGRIVEEIHTDLVTGAENRVRRYWDGATPDDPDGDDAVGLLSAVAGAGFGKRFTYRADGALESRVIELAGWRTVETQLLLREDGGVRERVTTVRDGRGQILHGEAVRLLLDESGRDRGVAIDDVEVLRYAFGPAGVLDTVSFRGGGAQLTHDPHTFDLVGLAVTAPAWSAATSLQRNARGLVERETIAAGGELRDRTFTYTPRGFLAGGGDAEESWSYAYDGSGRLASTSAGVTYDDLGRLVATPGRTFIYGPDGHLARARNGDQEWTFITDESGQRLLKLVDGQPVAAYLPEGHLDASGLVEPLRFGGVLLGAIDRGAFVPLATDLRGTVIADADGTLLPASPYGDRVQHPGRAAALDYVEKGYDADLGLVRMGVRDYDPSLGEFVTPDPHFLARPEACIDDSASCTLYAYAGGNPLQHDDPDGQSPRLNPNAPPPPSLRQGQYEVRTRSFAPFRRFGGGWGGDDRGFSTDLNASARITQSTVVDIRAGTASTVAWSDESEKVSRGWTTFQQLLTLSWSFKNHRFGEPTPTASLQSNGQNAVLSQHVEGSNPLINAPQIDVYSDVYMIQKGNMLWSQGTIAGDRFPNAEMFIRDPAGSAVMLATFATTAGQTKGPFFNLPGGGRRFMAGVNVGIQLDDRGNFQRVLRDGQWSDVDSRSPAP
jgi:RHS repeat-associated protein